MNHKLFLFALACDIVGVAVVVTGLGLVRGQEEAQQQEDFETYTNENYQSNIDYPED